MGGLQRSWRILGRRFTHYLDCGADFMGTFLCPKIANCTLQICAAYCMPITPLNKTFKNI